MAAGGSAQHLERPENVAGERLFVGRAPSSWSRPEQMAARIGEQIVDEELRPGQRIREEDLARAFAVSRGPVRDALRILHAAGLVEVSSRRGTTVTPLTETDLREILDLREALIALAFRRFAAAAGADDVLLVRPHLVAAETLVEDDRRQLIWLEALDRLVLAIAHRAGNGRLARELTTLSLQATRYLRRGVPTMSARRDMLTFHREYLAAVERREDVEPFIVQLRQLVRTRMALVSASLHGV